MQNATKWHPSRAAPRRLNGRVGAAARPIRRRAFSFVELVVVVMIIGILAAVAAPTFYRSLRHHRLESAARRVKSDLELLRHSARMTSQTLECDFTGATYVLQSVPGLNRLSEPYQVDLTEPPFELESEGVMVDFGGVPPRTNISFDGYGSPVPAAGGTIVLSLGGRERTVTVESTGQITLSDD